MHLVKRRQLVPLSFAVAVLLLTASSMNLTAQDGWNAAVQSTSGPVSPSASYAIVDATQFSGNDLCAKINTVFLSYYPGTPGTSGTAAGVVIDARGVSGSALTCSAVNPWANLIAAEYNNGSTAFSNTVLLPAGTITIQKTWLLAPFTHLIGQGPDTTVIQAASGLGSNVDMFDMGNETTSSNPCYNGTAWDCPGIVIEHLGLIGSSSATNQNGIVNCCAQELSRVNDVSISTVATGLELSDQFSQNSGPYTNLRILGVNKCLAIGPASQGNMMINSRGVHGLTCSVNSGSSAAITIDGPSNSVEDISISISGSSAQDGILIGSQGPAQGNTLFNIQGSGTGLKNVIHVKSTGTGGAQTCPYTSNQKNYVCDLTIFGVAGTNLPSTIQDDLTGTTITDSTVAMYILGEYVGTTSASFGYSRFTTAAAAANTYATPWLVGANAPASSCSPGAIYSCTGGCGTGTLFECTGGGSTWKKIQ